VPLCMGRTEVRGFSRPTWEGLLIKHNVRGLSYPRGSSIFFISFGVDMVLAQHICMANKTIDQDTIEQRTGLSTLSPTQHDL
jgi:hypothetical protein